MTETLQRTAYSLALYDVTYDDGRFWANNLASLAFSAGEYSQFKYGHRGFATLYGKAMGSLLVEHLSQIAHPHEPIVMLGTPYKRLPNAARMLAVAAHRRVRLTGMPVEYTYIYQHRLVEGDYSKLAAAQRDARNRLKQRYIDPEDFLDRHVVVIDDIRITGSIERSILQLLAHIPTRSVTVCNLVRLDPQAANSAPQLEYKLNHTMLTGLPALLQLMQQRDQFVLTTRAVKYILESDELRLNWFLNQLDEAQRTALYEAVIDEGYDRMVCYASAVATIMDAA